jgi:hypothetical protein
LGQRETDSNNQLILISESTKHTKAGNGNLGFEKWDKFDPINWLIPLSVIPLSGAHCTKWVIVERDLGLHQFDHIKQPGTTSKWVLQ